MKSLGLETDNIAQLTTLFQEGFAAPSPFTNKKWKSS